MLKNALYVMKKQKNVVLNVKKFGTVEGIDFFHMSIKQYYFLPKQYRISYSRECQVKDWVKHKSICDKITKNIECEKD